MIKELKNKPRFELITTNEALTDACRRALEKKEVALDTEFVRVRSYYPKLGLVQLYDGEQVSLIDPNEINDFSPLIELLSAQNVMKILHAGSEDLEVFQHYFQQLPTPMRDTQIMANFLAFPNSTGLATLIKHYFHLEIDKGESRTDWLARPLTEKQLQYAVGDVWYLLPLYHQMQEKLAQTEWQSAVDFECKMLAEKRLEAKDADKAYLNIPNVWKLNPQELMCLKLLAKWRQEEAIRRDLALNFVVRAENLWLVAKHNPKHTSELLELGLSVQEVRIHGKKLLQIVDQVKRIDEKDYPETINKLSDDPRYKKTLKQLQSKLKEIAVVDLPQEVIASKRSLEGLMKWVWHKNQDPDCQPDLMLNWRKPFGEKLLTII